MADKKNDKGAVAQRFGDERKKALEMALSVVLTQQHLCHRQQAGAAVSCADSDDAGADVLCWARRAARLAMGMLLADPAQLDAIEDAANAQGWPQLS